MSGVEIVELIEEDTRGFWKPSPGSIYPLLARLHDKGYTTESSTSDSGLKRYILTDEGELFFKKQVQLGRNFMTKLKYLVPMFIGGFHLNTRYEHLRVADDAVKKLAKIYIDVRTTIRDDLTLHDAEKIAAIINDCADQLEIFAQRIKEKGITEPTN
jgi:DNA-binding PadR family transcriptional regulator